MEENARGQKLVDTLKAVTFCARRDIREDFLNDVCHIESLNREFDLSILLCRMCMECVDLESSYK